MSRPVKMLMGIACLIGLAGIILVTVGNAPVAPNLEQSEYKLVPVVERGTTGNPGTGEPTNFLSTTFTMTIPSRLKGQPVEISKVDFFSEQNVLIGTAEVSNVVLTSNEALRIGANFADKPVVPPLTEGVVSFRATLEDTSGLAAGTKIYTRVEGKAGNTDFRARSQAVATSSGA